MESLLENLDPTLLLLGVIAFLIYWFDLRRLLTDWFEKWQDSNKDCPPKPRPRIDHARTLAFDQRTRRWQLLGPNGEPAPALVVRGGDTITYNFEIPDTDESSLIHFQYPESGLFAGFEDLEESVDPWIAVVRPGDALTLTVADRIKVPCPTIVYAIYIKSTADTDTGYVKGGSPPEIILEHA